MGDIADAVQAGVNNGTLTAANTGLRAANAKLQGRFTSGLLLGLGLGLAMGVGIAYSMFAPPSAPTWRERERNLYVDPER